MKIQKLSIFGLKGIIEKIIEPTMINQIFGRNESGKSTIREAIVFALYGRINGSTQTDGAINNTMTQTKVILEFITGVGDDAKSHIVERTKSIKSMSIKLNGRASNQDAIEGLIGVDYQLFSSAFCVGDFMKFEPKDRRNILLQLVDPKDSRSVYWEKLTGTKDCPYDLSDLDTSHRIAKDNLDEIDSKIVMTTNKKQFLANDISNLQQVIDEEQANKVPARDFEEAEAKYRTVMKQEPKLEAFINDEPEPVGQLEEDLSTAEAELQAALAEKPDDAELKALTFKVNNKTEEAEKLKQSSVCPTCKRPFDDLAKKTDQLKIVNKVLTDLKAEGRKVRDALDKAENVWEERVHKLQVKVTDYRKKISNRQEQNSSKVTDGKAEWAVAHTKWEQDEEKTNNEFKSIKLRFDQSEYQRIQKDLAVTQLAEKKAELEKEDVALKKLDRGKLKDAVNALGARGIIFEEINSQLAEIQKFLPKDCKLELIEKNKTNDGVKSVFNLTCDDLPYAWLSTGKRLSIDVHLSDAITSELGINAMFVDNIELLTLKIVITPTPEKQMFVARAKDQDFEIKSS